MATNSDGGIVLSVNIDSSEVSSDIKKVVSEINKQVQTEAKNIKAVESVNQAKEKTVQAQLKTEQAVYKTLEAESKTLTAEQNLATAKEKSAIVSAKVVQEEEKAYQAIAKAQVAEQQVQQAVNATYVSEEKVAQTKEKTAQATTQSAINQQKLAQEIEKGYQAEEKTTQAELKSQQEQQKILLNEEKIKQAKEKTAQAEEKTKQAIIKTTLEQNKMKNATNAVTSALKTMSAQLGLLFSLREIISFSNEAGKLSSQTEAYLTRLSTLYGESAQDVYDWANANAYAFGMSKSTAYQATAQFGNLFTTFASASESAELSKAMLQATAVVASQTGRTYEETFEKMQSGIYGNTRAIDDLGISVRKESLKQTQAWQTVSQNGTKSWNDLTDAELQHLRVLGIIEQSTSHYGSSVMQTTALIRAQFNAAWTDFKTTWGTVINGVLIPVLQVLTQIISAVTAGLSWIAKFMGKSLDLGKSTTKMNTETEGMSKNIEKAAGSQDELTKGVKGTNKELKKTLAGFDELQILQGNDEGATGGTGGGGVTTNIETDDKGDDGGKGGGSGSEPNVSSWQSAIAGLVEVLVGVGLIALGIILLAMPKPNIVLGLTCILAGITAIGIGLVTLGNAFDGSKAKDILLIVTGISGFILLTLGVLLLFFGSKAWGVACIIGGVALLGYTAYKIITGGMETEQIMSVLSALLAFVGGALLAIGVFLCFMTVYPMGIACIIAGVAALVGAGAAAKKSDGKEVTDWLELLLIAISGFLIVLGIVLCIFGVLPLGIGLIVAGAAILAVTLINKSDTLPEEVKNWVNIIFTIVSTAALVLGIIMLCMGHVSPLSIGLVVVGAAGLAAEIAINWEWLKAKLQGWIGVVTAIVSAALLVLGIIILVASGGAQLVLGISLIVAGAAGLAVDVAANWDGIVDKVKDIWKKIKDYWDEHIKKIFTKDWWLKLAKKCGNGLIDGFESAVNGIIGLFENMVNFVVEQLNKLSIDIPDWVPGAGGKTFGFNLEKVKMKRVSIPRLAQGGVIPANREFLAVLGDQKRGTNIEAPAELIKQMAKEAYQEMGLASMQNQQVIREEHYNLNQTELMTIMYKLVKGGERLNGTSLVKQGGM